MAERGKGFPRISLQSAVKIVEASSKFGKNWTREQFATFGSQSGASSARSGAFAARLAALKDYGLVTTDIKSVYLSDLGTKVVKPISSSERSEAIRQAFLSVASFKGLIEGLEHGIPLPKDQVAQYAVFNLGISRDSKDKFLSNFVDSGRFVDLVEQDKAALTVTIKDLVETGLGNVKDTSTQEQLSLPPEFMPTMAGPVAKHQQVIHGSEQGANYSGESWSLTVLLKHSLRLDGAARSKFREMLAAADELSDLLHELEDQGKS